MLQFVDKQNKTNNPKSKSPTRGEITHTEAAY